MSRCFPFPPAGYRVNPERYEELIDAIKVLKEKLRKEKKKKVKGRREKRNGRSKQKKKTDDVDICDEIVEERRRRIRDVELEHETERFERSCSHLILEKDDEDQETSSSYGSTGNNKKTKKRKMCTSETRSSSSSSSNITEELEYKYEQLIRSRILRYDVDAYTAATLPPINLDWLYPKSDTRTMKTRSKEDERRGGAEIKRQRRSFGNGGNNKIVSCSWSSAQYLHQIDAFALPFVVPF